MQCVNDACESMKTSVYETRATPAVVYRRRKCMDCGCKFISIEVLSPVQEIPQSARVPKSKETA